MSHFPSPRLMPAVTAFAAISLVLADPALAAGSGMPWEAPLQSILESIEGPVAKIVAVIIIIVTGLTLAFGDTGGGMTLQAGAEAYFSLADGAEIVAAEVVGQGVLLTVADPSDAAWVSFVDVPGDLRAMG